MLPSPQNYECHCCLLLLLLLLLLLSLSFMCEMEKVRVLKVVVEWMQEDYKKLDRFYSAVINSQAV